MIEKKDKIYLITLSAMAIALYLMTIPVKLGLINLSSAMFSMSLGIGIAITLSVVLFFCCKKTNGNVNRKWLALLMFAIGVIGLASGVPLTLLNISAAGPYILGAGIGILGILFVTGLLSALLHLRGPNAISNQISELGKKVKRHQLQYEPYKWAHVYSSSHAQKMKKNIAGDMASAKKDLLEMVFKLIQQCETPNGLLTPHTTTQHQKSAIEFAVDCFMDLSKELNSSYAISMKDDNKVLSFLRNEEKVKNTIKLLRFLANAKFDKPDKLLTYANKLLPQTLRIRNKYDIQTNITSKQKSHLEAIIMQLLDICTDLQAPDILDEAVITGSTTLVAKILANEKKQRLTCKATEQKKPEQTTQPLNEGELKKRKQAWLTNGLITASIYTCNDRSEILIPMLLKHGANVDGRIIPQSGTTKEAGGERKQTSDGEAENAHKSPLFFAAREYHFKAVEILLKAGASVVMHDAASPLHKVIESVAIRDFYLKKDEKEAAIKTVSLLIKAHLNGDHSLEQKGQLRVLNRKIEIKEECTPLIAATLTKNCEVVAMLVKAGANPNSTDKKERKPLEIALDEYAEKNSQELRMLLNWDGKAMRLLSIITTLLKSETTDLTPCNKLLLSQDITEQKLNFELAKTMILAMAKRKQFLGTKFLNHALKNERLDIAQVLVEVGVNPNTAEDGSTQTPFMQAIALYSQTEQSLNTLSIEDNALGRQSRASYYRKAVPQQQLLVTMINHGADTKKLPDDILKILISPVKISASNQYTIFIAGLTQLQWLTSPSDSLLLKNTFGKLKKEATIASPLMETKPEATDPTNLSSGNFDKTPNEVIKHIFSFLRPSASLMVCRRFWLASKTMDFLVPGSMKNIWGFESWFCSTAFVQLRLDHGANPNSKDERGQTALHIAAARNHSKTVQLLLANSANPNSKDEKGQTALHIAATRNHLKTVQLLLANSANPTLKDASNLTPLDCATPNSEVHKIMKESVIAISNPGLKEALKADQFDSKAIATLKPQVLPTNHFLLDVIPCNIGAGPVTAA